MFDRSNEKYFKMSGVIDIATGMPMRQPIPEDRMPAGSMLEASIAFQEDSDPEVFNNIIRPMYPSATALIN